MLRPCILLLVFVFARPAFAQDACPPDLPSGLAAGLWARVAHDDVHNLRAEPTTAAPALARIPAGDIVRVLDGPQCAAGYVWWAVAYAGTAGWAAERRLGAAAWLEPLAGQEPSPPRPDDPPGCQRPPDDYTRLWVEHVQLNLRTLAMLDHAQALLTAAGGRVRLRDALMQGSYNPGGVAASFGTHDGGGAVDLSVRSRVDGRVLTDEIPLLLTALRTAGFAAWLRDAGELYPGSPIHIHAIAVGDRDLSPAARAQIDGSQGYLRGYNGLPLDYGGPAFDPLPPVVCGWMADLGFPDLRPPGA